MAGHAQKMSSMFGKHFCMKHIKVRFCSVESPRNMFELYSKNSNWLGVYKRHPIVNEKTTRAEMNKLYENEQRKTLKYNISELVSKENTEYKRYSQRCGAIGRNLGQTVLWGKDGFKHLCTLVQIEDCQVMQVHISHSDGGNDKVTQLIVGAHDITDEKFLANISREKMEWYIERGLFPKQYWSGFPVSKDGLLEPGTNITASHFVPDQLVRVTGVSIERGFQGVMRRWGMKGQPASHGQTKTHRKMGATGGGQDPGRIFPGKRMAGHMGGDKITLPPNKILRINTKYNIIYIKGTVPGDIGSFVKLRDGFHKKKKQAIPPFPANFNENQHELDEDLYADYISASTGPSVEFPPYKI